MRILFITNGIGSFDGSSKQLAIIVNGLSQKGYRCYVYGFNNNKCGQKFLDNVIFVKGHNPINKKILQWLIIPFRIRKIAKENHIDLIVGWRTNGGCYAVLSSLFMPVKTLFCERSDPYMENNSYIHKIVGIIAGSASGGVFQTEKAKEFYKRLSSKAIVLPNPYSPNNKEADIMPWNKRANTIVYFGRIDLWQKRLDLLLMAFEIIHKQKPEYRLIIYGKGKDKNKSVEIANKLGIAEYVTFSEPVHDVIEKMQQAKILLLSSDFEGIPNVVLDAFDAGLPVVATDCSPGGMHILVENGENGYIVPFRDFRSLANKTLELIDNELTAEKFIRNGKIKLKDFQPDTIFNQWNDYLINIIKF